MKDISQTIPFNINNTIACKRFMEAKIDGILIILGRKMRLIWLCFIVTSLITEAVFCMELCIYWKDVKIYLNILKSQNNKCKNNFIILLI